MRRAIRDTTADFGIGPRLLVRGITFLVAVVFLAAIADPLSQSQVVEEVRWGVAVVGALVVTIVGAFLVNLASAPPRLAKEEEDRAQKRVQALVADRDRVVRDLGETRAQLNQRAAQLDMRKRLDVFLTRGDELFAEMQASHGEDKEPNRTRIERQLIRWRDEVATYLDTALPGTRARFLSDAGLLPLHYSNNEWLRGRLLYLAHRRTRLGEVIANLPR